MGLQVLLGALITGIAAAASLKAARTTTVLFGGLATLVASFLARIRGSGEPETSRERARDLQKVSLPIFFLSISSVTDVNAREQFIRSCRATIVDWGEVPLDPYHPNDFPNKGLLDQIDKLRHEYDELIKTWNGFVSFCSLFVRGCLM